MIRWNIKKGGLNRKTGGLKKKNQNGVMASVARTKLVFAYWHGRTWLNEGRMMDNDESKLNVNLEERIKVRIKRAERYIFYQFKAGQIEQNLNDSAKSNCTIVQLGSIPEGQLRPLARLEPDQQREAWQKAVETAPEGKVTAAHVSIVGAGKSYL